MTPPPQPLPAVPAERGQPGPSPEYRRIVSFLSSRGALWIGAAWGAAEAALLFVVPDVWLGFVALYAPRRVVLTLLAIVAGALVGATLLFLATPALGGDLSRVLVGLPGISPTDLDRARAELAAQGLPAFLNGPLQGLPVKLYIHAAALDGFGLPVVLVGVVLNRVERMAIFALIMVAVGLVARPVIARRPRTAAIVYGVAWTIFYAGYWAAAAV